MSPEIRPKSFGTFEKQAPGPWSGHVCQRHYDNELKEGLFTKNIVVKHVFVFVNMKTRPQSEKHATAVYCCPMFLNTKARYIRA